MAHREIIPYASRTGTRRNLQGLRDYGWRLLVSAKGCLRTEGFPAYALDNGAWTAYQKGEPFDGEAFQKALDWTTTQKTKPCWIAVPDIVAGGLASLRFSEQWMDAVSRYSSTILIPVQDGMEPADVEPILGPNTGIFIGGSTPFKNDCYKWGELAEKCSCYLHMGRVNSIRRIDLCRAIGCNSFDGSGPSRFRRHLEVLQRGLNQGYLPL